MNLTQIRHDLDLPHPRLNSGGVIFGNNKIFPNIVPDGQKLTFYIDTVF